ncbi:hypothetical protein BKA56DRAFT_625608 [Ilyonectria sp. MPI-CAGE-AT-0026]|nr:hypothetical protein BKA56DRAFT_625608 [Ilyonectria sp. MPI-CAGE-AT-0026]
MESASVPSPVPLSPLIQRLPNELLVQIFSFLDSPSNLQERLREDTVKIARPIDARTDAPIKNASLVCRLWRQSVLQFLFRYVVWSFQRFYKPKSGDIASQIQILDFLKHNGLSRDVESFTILMDPPKEAGGFRYADGQFWGLLPPDDCPTQPPTSWNLLWSVVSTESPQFPSTQRPVSADGLSAREANASPQRLWDNNWLWQTIFGELDPLRITLIGSAVIISSLFSRSVDLTSECAFNSHYHVLSLSRTSRSVAHPGDLAGALGLLPSHDQGIAGSPIPSDLFSIRDWASLLVNEGSFVPVYSTYEFFHYSPPTLLPVILSTKDSSFTRLQKTLRSFSYIGTFPLSRHIRDVVIPYCPPVEHLYIQIMPRALDFWQSGKIAHIDFADLCLECDTAYSLIMREVFDPHAEPGLKGLQVFESGDAATEEAWNMAMQYVQIHGLRGWRMKRDGYFVRQTVDKSSEALI